ncbi:MAG: hypothetical protein R2789_05035 [Microthrixaceae bacterium]
MGPVFELVGRTPDATGATPGTFDSWPSRTNWDSLCRNAGAFEEHAPS